MGMFDELRCEYPLPDGFSPGEQVFQTKDTPAQYLERYVLQDDGALIHEATGERIAFHGVLTFYTDNILGSSARGCITRDDAPPWRAEYCALYDHGVLRKIEGEKAPYTAQPHISRAAFYAKEPAP